MAGVLTQAITSGISTGFDGVYPSTVPPVERPTAIPMSYGLNITPVILPAVPLSTAPVATPVTYGLPSTAPVMPIVPPGVPNPFISLYDNLPSVKKLPLVVIPSTTSSESVAPVPTQQPVIPPTISTAPPTNISTIQQPTTVVTPIPQVVSSSYLPPLSGIPNVTSGTLPTLQLTQPLNLQPLSQMTGIIPATNLLPNISTAAPQWRGLDTTSSQLPQKQLTPITVQAETASSFIAASAPQNLSTINAYIETPSIDRILAELSQDDIINLLKIKHTKEGKEKITSRNAQYNITIQELAAKLKLPPNMSDTDRQCYLLALLNSINRV